ncbi:plasmid replication initiation protein [Azomonas agilis]|uniref:Plasmid replication initiation protein n=1 Tax=Azomonas agilis TaxID=116849 RepID=A0A562HZG5_9GAMM|nr:replication initiation protein RepM [Azomonas agilis]TWH63785.1 plasmid replication initiation protein [Azomonas agilis]
MSKNEVVKKDNSLINAAYTLSLSEQRLILLSVAEAGASPDALRNMVIPASTYAERFGLTRQAAYMALSEAVGQLFKRQFSYERITDKGNIAKGLGRWVQNIEYIKAEAKVTVSFSEKVLPLLCDLKNKFTYYGLEQISNITSVYAIRLYELLISWRSAGKTPFYELTDFRRCLGIAPDEYQKMNDFKKRVLDAAISQINEHTDILASYEQHKQGRTITGFSFTFFVKQNPISNVVDSQTDAKSSKPKRLIISKTEAESMALPGENYDELYQRLSLEYTIK